MRRLTAWVLERERAKRSGEAPPAASSTLKHQLQCLPAGRLFRGIQRHRLETVLQSDSAVSELLPDLQVNLQHAARRERMEALALVSLTREMAALFAEAGIPLLVIKESPWRCKPPVQPRLADTATVTCLSIRPKWVLRSLCCDRRDLR